MTALSKNKEVLVVDDNNLNLDLVCKILAKSGFNTFTALNGIEAIKIIQTRLPDLIILDGMMPHLDGFETCRLLKQNPATQEVPIIFMSALVEAAKKVNAFQLGANDYITKPFQQAELIVRVKRQMELVDLRQALEYQNQVLQNEIGQKYEAEVDLLDTNEQLTTANQALGVEIKNRQAVERELQAEITERMQIEKQLKQSLVEKNLLLKEIHHRVKNNLFIVSSLLESQSEYVSDPYASKMLSNSQNRIISMALIHEQLHCDTGACKINFQEYLTTLVKYLVNSYLTPKISLQADVEQVYLNLETVNPCGLIVNELISNAVEHAFVGREQGKINLSFQQTAQNNFVLTIADDGVGSKHKNFFESNSLGLDLVTTLVEQLEGKIEVNSDRGTQIKITFVEQNYEARI